VTVVPRLPLPSYALNGLSVALGIGLVHGVFALLGGAPAVAAAGAAAICTSLGDLPDTTGRNTRRVLGAAVASLLAGLVVTLLEPHRGWLGVVVGIIAALGMLVLAWGPRAGPVSFAPILAMVFAMATPPGPVLGRFGWSVAGAALYAVWAYVTSIVLQRRWRRLALVAALRALADLLRARAALLLAPYEAVEGAGSAGSETLATWVAGEATLAERLQAARDLLFAAADDPVARRETAMLLHAIDLRDVLLASRLDLDLFGRDAAAELVLRRLAATLVMIADALTTTADALRDRRAPALAPIDTALDPGDAMAPDDPRRRVLPTLVRRLDLMRTAIEAMGRLAGGADEPLALTRDQLQRFVAPKAWPLAALRRHLVRSSPVLRHALRMGLALGVAYALALAWPWHAHPHWLVLSVAVVLRGNLEQTLARRNSRVYGTMLGCVLVLALARTESPPLLEAVFLLSAGTAHAFVNVRYWVTATAATVMALLQAHLADPQAGFAIGERLVDTFVGALLGWTFSYVLPSWERFALPQTIARALEALRAYAGAVLASDADRTVEERLARRAAYDALAALAGSAQRGAVEPRRARVPLAAIASLLDHGQRLMAHLSSIRLTRTRGDADLASDGVRRALRATADAIAATLGGAPLSDEQASADERALAQVLPSDPPTEDPVPWLERRLVLARDDATRLRRAADAALARLAQDAPSTS